MSSSIRFFNESSLDLPMNKDSAAALLLKVMRSLGKPGVKINIIAKSDEELREMKKKYFDIDLYTDVITFTIEDEPVLEGEIYCSPERIIKNAGRFSESPSREFARVLIHGAAHLCGYRDYSEEERREMRQLEDEFLTQFYDN
ncbi:MAG: rRNA maturation RNase YbeY [Candidatus Marinimicrobia bacterium]|nr:rRNA maturation RNase YbeY [Candidatus Neomarinimicrobiota bacterium]